MSVARWVGLALLLLVVAGCDGAEGALVGTSLGGESVDLLAGAPEAVVLFFVTPDCPISNRYVPEMNRLATELREEGVATFLVYPDPAFSIEQIREHQVEFSLEPRICPISITSLWRELELR